MSVIHDILVFPKRAFEKIKEKPFWWQGFAVVFASQFVGISLQVWSNYEYASQVIASGIPQGIPEGAEWIVPFTVFMTTVLVLVVMLMFRFVDAIVINLLARPLGGQPNFSNVLGVVAWSGMPSALGALLRGLMAFLSYGFHFQTGLGVLASPETILRGLLSGFEIFSFWLWSAILMAEGMVRVLGCKRWGSYLVAFGLWVLWILLFVGLVFFKGSP